MEALVLALVCFAPWLFGAVEPLWEFVLYSGLALLLVLWAVRSLLEGEFTWHRCTVALCLAGLFLLGALQTVALPAELLTTLSPATARLYAKLLPVQPEILPAGASWTSPPAGATLSLYPAASRRELVRLLAVLLLFVTVRNNLASTAALRRLSVVALCNGGLLACFGIVQFFTSPRQTLYWTYPAPNDCFGPFVCRNHFPFYVNICFGLGVGLLLVLLAQGSARRRRWQVLFGKPQLLWTVCALSAMLCGSVLTLSRGGLLALVGAAIVCLGLRLVQSLRLADLASQLLAAALIPTLALAPMLALGFGFDPLVSRMATLQQGRTFEQARGSLWARVLPLAQEYPLWGTGYGTFRYIEPLQRIDGAEAHLVYENAHNDYLEALVEGGLARLLLSVLAIGLLCRQAARALHRLGDSARSGLVWGALFALVTVLIHSGGDFGLHVPAIAVLLTVLCAQLAALGDDPASVAPLRLRGPAPLLAALTALALGFALVSAGWEAHLYQSQADTAARLQGNGSAAGRQQRLVYLHAAAQRNPDPCAALIELAQAYAELYDEQTNGRDRREALQGTAELVLDSATAPGVPSAAARVLISDRRSALRQTADTAVHQTYLVPALRAFLQARAACPLRPEPHLALASYAHLLPRAEPRAVHLDRAKSLAPADPQLWYLCGLQEYTADTGRAFASWRHSLELSDRYLPDILAHAEAVDPAALLTNLLPDDPTLLLAAASQLYPEPAAKEKRRPLLVRGLALLEARTAPLRAEDLHTQAKLHAALGRNEDALSAYGRALALEPFCFAWRMEHAQLLFDSGRSREAESELRLILAQRPADTAARALQQQVARHIAENE
jgi:O-antigen ligase